VIFFSIGKLSYGKRRSSKSTFRTKTRPREEWIIAEGDHKPIVPDKSYKKAQTILSLKRKKHSARRNYNSGFLLTGLIKCGQCGAPMHGRAFNKDGRKYAYYVCSSPRQKGSGTCGGMCVQLKAIEEEITDQLFKIAATKKPLASLRKAVDDYNTRTKKDRRPLSREKVTLEKKIALLERRKDALIDIALDGPFTKEDLERKSRQISRDLELARERLFNIETRLNNIEIERVSLSQVYETFRDLKKNWKYFDMRGKQDVLAGIVKEIRVMNKRQIAIDLFFAAGEGGKNSSSLMTDDTCDRIRHSTSTKMSGLI
jgi:site-specific DNA recombinase